MKPITILGIKITPSEAGELHKEITSLIRQGGPAFILSGNVHGINLARRIDWLADFYNRADLVRVDGAGVVLGARLLGHRIPKRLTWADWGWMLAEYLAEKGHSLFLLGGPPSIAEKAAEKLQEYAPRLNILGTHHGYFDKNGLENELVINRINQLSPDILVIGFGMPLQEDWLLKNYRHMKVKVFITAGAAFEYLSGSVKRCPKWMGDLGFEWLFRLYQDPKRMGRRYAWGNASFLINVLLERWGWLRN